MPTHNHRATPFPFKPAKGQKVYLRDYSYSLGLHRDFAGLSHDVCIRKIGGGGGRLPKVLLEVIAVNQDCLPTCREFSTYPEQIPYNDTILYHPDSGAYIFTHHEFCAPAVCPDCGAGIDSWHSWAAQQMQQGGSSIGSNVKLSKDAPSVVYIGSDRIPDNTRLMLEKLPSVVKDIATDLFVKGQLVYQCYCDTLQLSFILPAKYLTYWACPSCGTVPPTPKIGLQFTVI